MTAVSFTSFYVLYKLCVQLVDLLVALCQLDCLLLILVCG